MSNDDYLFGISYMSDERLIRSVKNIIGESMLLAPYITELVCRYEKIINKRNKKSSPEGPYEQLTLNL